MHLYDLVDVNETTWLYENGWLNETEHPTEPLRILNYSKRAQTAVEPWSVESLHHCRGLIYNTTNGEIVARPFPKFWNYGQAGAPMIPLDALVQVTDKADGSLGIMYRRPSDGELAIATRGSFLSEQAVHATQTLYLKHNDFEPNPDWTMLFEIVYPENRIVLDYGARDDVVLLGGVLTHYKDLVILGPNGFPEWKGPKTEIIYEGNFDGALALKMDRPNSEGYVIRRMIDGGMVKLKQEDYKALHAALFGLNQRRIYEIVMAGRGLGQPGQYEGVPEFDTLLAQLPDEFHDWARNQRHQILETIRKRADDIFEEYGAIVEGWSVIYEVDDQRSRKKAFAAEVAKVKTPYAWALFAIFNGAGRDDIEDQLLHHLDKDKEIDAKVRPVNQPVEEV
jgi:RNA ligase